jgi:DNA-binding winged helix-turn-helix (wHTH) protein/tetratricopeptide (TPR) repeat protein
MSFHTEQAGPSGCRTVYEFGAFVLDPGDRRLSRLGEPVPVSPKTFELLVALVERSGRVVEKHEMLALVWPGTFVEEANLAVHISTLRKTLGDGIAGVRYIETVPKRGYRFVAPVRACETPFDSPHATIQVRETTGRTVPVPEEVVDTPDTKTAQGGGRGARHWVGRGAVGAGVVAVTLLVALVALNRSWPGSAGRLAPRHSPDPGAREAYLKGRHLWNSRTSTGLHRSVAFFKEAIDRDPGYALAYAGLADSYAFDFNHAPLAVPTARKALELDPTLGEAHATIGFVEMFWNWNWSAAERELRIATELSPTYATGQQWYSILLAVRGRTSEAGERMRKARDLDPLSIPINADLGQQYLFEHEFDKAIEQCRKTIELQPDYAPAHAYLSSAYVHAGRRDEAVEAYQRAMRLLGKPEASTMAISDAYRNGGMAGVWTARIEMGIHLFSLDYEMAECHALFGDRDNALAALQRACDLHDAFLPLMRANPAFDSLRDDPRYVEIERGLGFRD